MAMAAGWGCEACLGYNPPTTPRCETCGVLDPEQAKAIRLREEEAREEERRRLVEHERQARQALAKLTVGEAVKLCSAVAAQDGFEDLARRIHADEQAAVERAAHEAAELAARVDADAAAAEAEAAAEADAQALAAERGEGYDEALSELEAMLGSASADAAARRAPSPEPQPEPELELEPEPEPNKAVRRHPDRLWNSHKRAHCGQQAVVIATEMADATVLLRFDDSWELCASLNVVAVLLLPTVCLIDHCRRCGHCGRRSAGYPVECVRQRSEGTSEGSDDDNGRDQGANEYEDEDKDEDEEELVIIPEARNAIENIVNYLEFVEQEIAAERAEMEAKRVAAEAEAWRINPGRCAAVLQARWRGYSVRLNQHRAEVRAAEKAYDAARSAEHSSLGNLLGLLERSAFDGEAVLPRTSGQDGPQRKTAQELKIQKFAARWSTRRNVVRSCFYALVDEMQLARKIARYNWAATFVQARYRGYRLRKDFRRMGRFSRRPKRDKDLSADMLLLRAATAGDMTTSQLVAREKLGGGSSSSASAAKVKSRFRMDPTAFRKQGLGGTGGVDLAAEAEARRFARVQELSKRCLRRLGGEAVAYCFDLWAELRNRAVARAAREVGAPATEAYEKATTEMERGEWEAAGSYFSLALKAGHPDIWECHFLRGIACSRYGAAEIAVKEFGLAIQASEHRSAAWFNRGVAQLRLGLLEEAFGDLKMTLKLEPGHRKAKETLQLVKEELAMESKANKLPNLKRDGKTAYNVKVVGKYRVRPVSSQTLAAFEEAAQLKEDKGGAKAQRLLAAAGLGRSGSFATTISAAHHVQPQSGQGGGRKIDRPDFSWPDFNTNPLGEISQNFPVDPFNSTGDGLQDADGDGDIDDEDEQLFELLGEFSAEEVEWLDQAVMLKQVGDWEGVAAWINAAALDKKKQREQDRHKTLGTSDTIPPLLEDREQKRPDATTKDARLHAGRPTASSSVAVSVSPDGKSEKQGAAAAALREVVGRTAEECKAEWERRIDRYTANGTWVGHGLDRRALTGRTTAEEAMIAKQEMYERLKTLECSHMTTMRQCNPQQIYPRTEGAWFCDECGLPNPVGRMFHCMACNDYDLCSSCMRTSNANSAAATGTGGPNRWARVQADETLVGRVLDSGSTNAKGANRGGLDLFSGERKRTAFASYHNPYSGAQVVHGVLRYPNTVREIPGLDDALRAKEREKIVALGRVLRRRGSAQYQPPGLA